MNDYIKFFIEVYTKFFFLLTPFFVLSMFLTFTKDYDSTSRRKIAIKVTVSTLVTCFTVMFFGNFMFSVFGITLDAFRIGAGSLLFLSAVNLVQGKKEQINESDTHDIAVVPLTIPITVGPATIGALIVMSAETSGRLQLTASSLGLTAAVISVGIILFLSSKIKYILGDRGIVIVSKITGVILSAIAAQMVFSGIRNFLSH